MSENVNHQSDSSECDDDGGSECDDVTVIDGADTSTSGKSASDYDSDYDLSCDSEDPKDALYLPPMQESMVENIKKIEIPKCVFVGDLTMLDRFVQQINNIRGCKTPGCKGDLTPMSIKSLGLGGSVCVSYACNGCGICGVQYEASCTLSNASCACSEASTTELSVALQVAFIVAGCTHATYTRVLKHALGVDAVVGKTFYSTLKKLRPVVKEMVDEMCECAKQQMKSMDQLVLGSWQRAVTTADGAWMTRGHHSKNMTFSVRNYKNGALLYYEHLCQRGGKGEELYPGTSKSAEGFAALSLFERAKKEGMNVEVQWQDADSSSSNGVQKCFPDAKIMLCGGHAGRAHKKKLEGFLTQKSFSAHFTSKHRSTFADVKDNDSRLKCHCSNNHKQGCGCLTIAFIAQARNYFSHILSDCGSAEEFAERLLGLSRHACDVHEWEGGRCSFHKLRKCTCGSCDKKAEPKCKGKEYHTKHVLTCPFHSFVYEIECNDRASDADKMVHPDMKRGHSNFVEASHNVFIRFRSKALSLQKCHYETSTNLALLQSNMTYMYSAKGEAYHWIPELYTRLKLPVFDGLQEALTKANKLRKVRLDCAKTEESKRKRIGCKKAQQRDAEARKAHKCAKDHTYGKDSQKPKVVGHGKRKQLSDNAHCACGSFDHLRKTHSSCPLNKGKIRSPLATLSDNDQSVHSDIAEVISDEGVTSDECICGTDSKAHKRYCPANPRIAKQAVRGSSTSSSTLKRKGGDTKSDAPSSKKHKPAEAIKLEIGSYVCVHSSRLGQHQHLLCRIAEIVDGCCRLCCGSGLLTTCYACSELTPLSSYCQISLASWRLSPKVSLADAASEAANLAKCECVIAKSTDVDLTGSSPSPIRVVAADNVWVNNTLYELKDVDEETVVASTGWLLDRVINAAQLLMLQESPRMQGLQPPTLAQKHLFDVHQTEPFVQIINVAGQHWCVVSNVGCNRGVVNVYDSLYPNVLDSTIKVIASLVFCLSPTLTIRIMDVDMQSNASDCGVHAIANAFELCCGSDPCILKLDHELIRTHLAMCLEQCRLTPFPNIGERSCKNKVKGTQTVHIYCVCRLPEDEELPMAQCDVCGCWFHKHCQDIPDSVFEAKNENVRWACDACKK